METVALSIVKKPAGTTATTVRLQGEIPAIYYGSGVPPQQVAVEYEQFRKAYRQAGKSTIVNLKVEGSKDVPVLIHEMQFDPKSDRIIHVDFLAVDLHKKIHARIPIVLVGISPAVKELAGVLVLSKDTIQVSCLPTDLVHKIEVDVSSLVDFHKSIKVRDIQLPTGITVLDSGDLTVASVSAPRAEEVEAVAAVAAPVEGAVAGAEGAVPGAAGASAAAGTPGAAAAAAPEKGKEKGGKEKKK